jgi:hypothetical protein
MLHAQWSATKTASGIRLFARADVLQLRRLLDEQRAVDATQVA